MSDNLRAAPDGWRRIADLAAWLRNDQTLSDEVRDTLVTIERIAVEGQRAALASPSPEPLDVERLARALVAWFGPMYGTHEDATDDAEGIAAEYARLSEDS